MDVQGGLGKGNRSIFLIAVLLAPPVSPNTDCEIVNVYRALFTDTDVVLGNQNDEDREEISDVADQFGVNLEDVKGRFSGTAYTRAIYKGHTAGSGIERRVEFCPI